jgi:hypothetical protein
LLRTVTDGYQIQITLGSETPQDGFMPVGAVVIPGQFAEELAKTLA